MRERKPIEEIIFAIFEMVLTVVMTVIFLVVLVTDGEVPALITLVLVFGILLNVLASAYSFYKGYKIIARLMLLLAVACLVVILL